MLMVHIVYGSSQSRQQGFSASLKYIAQPTATGTKRIMYTEAMWNGEATVTDSMVSVMVTFCVLLYVPFTRRVMFKTSLCTVVFSFAKGFSSFGFGVASVASSASVLLL